MKIYEKIEELEKEKKSILKYLLENTDLINMEKLENLNFINFALKHLRDVDDEDDGDEFFNVDKLFDGMKNFATGGETMYSIQRRLMIKVEKLKQKSNATKIITNGNLASVLQDMAGYSITPADHPKFNSPDDTKTPYPMGQIGDLKLFVDAYQRWDDNRILFYEEDNGSAPGKLVSTLKVKDTNGVLI